MLFVYFFLRYFSISIWVVEVWGFWRRVIVIIFIRIASFGSVNAFIISYYFPKAISHLKSYLLVIVFFLSMSLRLSLSLPSSGSSLTISALYSHVTSIVLFLRLNRSLLSNSSSSDSSLSSSSSSSSSSVSSSSLLLAELSLKFGSMWLVFRLWLTLLWTLLSLPLVFDFTGILFA